MEPTVSPPWRALEAPADDDRPTGRRDARARTRPAGWRDPAVVRIVAVVGLAVVVVARRLLAGGHVWLGRRAWPSTWPPSGRSRATEPVGGVAATGEVVVEVVGAVARPGRGAPAGWLAGRRPHRGGRWLRPARRHRAGAIDLHLAAVLADGDRVVVPSRDDPAAIAWRRSAAPGGDRRRPHRPQHGDARAARHAARHRTGDRREDRRRARDEAPFASVDDLRSRGDPRREDVRAAPRARDRALTCRAAAGWPSARPAARCSWPTPRPGPARGHRRGARRSWCWRPSCRASRRWPVGRARRRVRRPSRCACCVAPGGPASRPSRPTAAGRGRWSSRRVGAPRDGDQVGDAAARRTGTSRDLPASRRRCPGYPAVQPGDRVAGRGPAAAPTRHAVRRPTSNGSARGARSMPTASRWPRRARAVASLEGLRRGAGDALATVLPEPEAGLAAGILIGLRDRVDRDVAAAFTTAGVSHVVAISGWNIAIVAAAVAAVAGRLGRRRRSVVTDRWRSSIYIAFAGASPSVLRAGAMAGVVLARARDRAGRAGRRRPWAGRRSRCSSPIRGSSATPASSCRPWRRPA